MNHLHIDSTLRSRAIQRAIDTDYFIDTLSLPINLYLQVPSLSRIQFPSARALLIRTSPSTTLITIHLLADTDLYSSFTNFEVDLTEHILSIIRDEDTITITLLSTHF